MKLIAKLVVFSFFISIVQVKNSHASRPFGICRDLKKQCLRVMDDGGIFQTIFDGEDFFVLGPIEYSTQRMKARKECRRMTRKCRRYHRRNRRQNPYLYWDLSEEQTSTISSNEKRDESSEFVEANEVSPGSVVITQ